MLLGARFGMESDGGGLPYDAEVEYLQGDGVAYIDTEVSFSEETFSNIDVELAVDIGVLTHTSTAVQRVAFLGFGTISGLGIARVSGKWRGLIKGTAPGNSVELSLTEAISNVSIKYDDTYGYCYQDGVLLGSIEKSNATTVLPDGMTMCVFGGKYPSNGEVKITVAKDPACRIGSFYVKNKTTGQAFDGIPVRKDGVGYMYDKISGQLFGNAAYSGAFIIGPDKV